MSLLFPFVFVATRKPCVHDCAAQMNFLLIPKELRPIADKVEARQRISEADALALSCQFCAVAAKKRDVHAFERSIDDIVSTVGEARRLGITEVHMVGGLHPTLKKDWYFNLL